MSIVNWSDTKLVRYFIPKTNLETEYSDYLPNDFITNLEKYFTPEELTQSLKDNIKILKHRLSFKYGDLEEAFLELNSVIFSSVRYAYQYKHENLLEPARLFQFGNEAEIGIYF